MLYIVGTPIGNLEDISLRALRILGSVSFVLCEDTRVTGKLLEYYKIKTPTMSYHQHSDLSKTNYILGLLAKGRDLALVSDAGTPGISDPGGKLVQAVIEKFGDEMKVESVPGPSAVTAALSISGLPTDKFIFLGFPPHKKGRQTFLKKIVASEFPVVVYESKHRIVKFLEELKEMTGKKDVDGENEDGAEIPNSKFQSRALGTKNSKSKKTGNLTSVVVARELSKMHETVYRGKTEDIINKIKMNQDDQKGEFVVIIGK